MQRFTLGGQRTRGDGLFGLGTVRGGIFPDDVRATVTTLFGVTDALHSTPHNGDDLSSGDGTPLHSAPFEATVAQIFAPIWQGPGNKTLYDFIDAAGTRHTKVIQPGEPDRGGNTVLLLYRGPFVLRDGTVAEFAAHLFCHLRELPTHIDVGAVLPPRSLVGHEGTTGYSTGPHLHTALAFLRRGDLAAMFPPDMSDVTKIESALEYIGLPAGEADVAIEAPWFTPEPMFSEHGAALVVFRGGMVGDLEGAARRAGARGAWLQDAGGTYRLLMVDGPQFVQQDVYAAFPGGVATNTAVTLIR